MLPCLSMNPHLPALPSPIRTAASPSANEVTKSNCGLITIVPCLSMNPHLPVLPSPIRNGASPSEKLEALLNCGLMTKCPICSAIGGLVWVVDEPDGCALCPQPIMSAHSAIAISILICVYSCLCGWKEEFKAARVNCSKFDFSLLESLR